MNAEEDGDEVFLTTDHCYGCRLGFKDDKPVYAPLAAKGGFLCCTVCGASYGPVLSGDKT
jgi:hypothetical protein